VETGLESHSLPAVEQLSLVNEKVDQMTQILKNLALVSRIDIGQEKIRKTKFKLKGLIDEVLADIIIERHQQSVKPEVKISCPAKLELMADWVKIAQILTNLLRNAIVHANGRPRIFLKVEKKNNMIQIVTGDNNSLIPKKDYQKIFTKFYQSRKARMKGVGLGLGLYISKKLVELMGGKIWVEGKKGSGNRFVFQLPVS